MVEPALSRRPRIALVSNPRAASGRAARSLPAVRARLETRCQVIGAGRDELAAVLAAGVDAVLVAGGDGTVHHVVQHLAGGSVPLGLVPLGTGNDVAAELGAPADPLVAADIAVDALIAGRVRRIDLGRAESAGGSWWWLTVLCTGFDARVSDRASRLRRPSGPRRYDLAIALEAIGLRAHRYQLGLDDGPAGEQDAVLLSVCNTSRYGGGKRLAPHAVIDDGRFEVCTVGPVSRFELLRLAPRLDRGAHVGHPAVRFTPAHTVTIAGEHVVYADGEPLGRLPVTTRCVPGALSVLVP